MTPEAIPTPQPVCDGGNLPRRDFLKVSLGFSLALTLAGTLPGCSGGAKAPAQGLAFLQPEDVALFSAIIPVVVLDLGTRKPAEQRELMRQTLANIDGTCAGLDVFSRGELRTLFDLLANGPLRYVLTGVGDWKEASPAKLQAFLTRWRGSRFATLNAGGNVLVRLVSGSYYAIPATHASVGYPGPLELMFNAVNA
jgi:hypothetical protein